MPFGIKFKNVKVNTKKKLKIMGKEYKLIIIIYY